MLIDVKRCTFLDSTAIAVILGARQRAQDAGIGFALVGHNPTIDRTLELTGLREELEILADSEQAIAAPRRSLAELGAAAGQGWAAWMLWRRRGTRRCPALTSPDQVDEMRSSRVGAPGSNIWRALSAGSGADARSPGRGAACPWSDGGHVTCS